MRHFPELCGLAEYGDDRSFLRQSLLFRCKCGPHNSENLHQLQRRSEDSTTGLEISSLDMSQIAPGSLRILVGSSQVLLISSHVTSIKSMKYVECCVYLRPQ